jgi:hypothetical protein
MEKRNLSIIKLEEINNICNSKKGLEDTLFSEFKLFSDYTHPVLEKFIQDFIDSNKESLPTEWHQKLIREFLLYSFVKASGKTFVSYFNEKFIVRNSEESKKFYTINGVLAVYDPNYNIYIRGGDSYHGYFQDPHGVFGEDKFPEGVEGTLLNSGYERDSIFVPHSNGDVFENKELEKLFQLLFRFSIEVKRLRGEPVAGIIMKDLSEEKEETIAPYKARKGDLMTIYLKDIFIPGDKYNIIKFE